MNAADIGHIEALLRRVVREELSQLLDGKVEPADKQLVPPGTCEVEDGRSPFSLTDAELTTAERSLTPEEGKILRTRVMAERCEKLGNGPSARRMRKRADNLEKQLQERRKNQH